MNPASRNRLIRPRIRISDVEDTRRGESFNERCPNGRIRGLNEAGGLDRTSIRYLGVVASGRANKTLQKVGQYFPLGVALMNMMETVVDVMDCWHF